MAFSEGNQLFVGDFRANLGALKRISAAGMNSVITQNFYIYLYNYQTETAIS